MGTGEIGTLINYFSEGLTVKKMLSLIFQVEQPAERKITYICGLGAKVGCERISEHSTSSDESHKYRLFSLSVGVYLACGNSSFKMVILFLLFSTA